jgi:Lar family restriction alleviation protein
MTEDQVERVELLPCPFCGSEAESHRDGWHFVKCASEECLIDGPVGRTEAEAIAAWNTRAAVVDEWRDVRTDPPPLDEQVVFAYFGPNASWHGFAAVMKQFQWECSWPEHTVEPTHWCPLPKAPDVTEKEKGE